MGFSTPKAGGIGSALGGLCEICFENHVIKLPFAGSGLLVRPLTC